jgi:hypothetical protein
MKRKNPKTFFFLLLLLLGIIFPLHSFILIPEVRASPEPGWLAGWSYRKQHNITGSSAGNQTDYQMEFKVLYGNRSIYDNNWVWDLNSPILEKGNGTDWDNALIGGGSVVKVNGTWYYYYSGKNASTGKWAIGVATSTDGVTFTKDTEHNPIVIHNSSDPDEDVWVWSPQVLYYNNTFYMYYTGRFTIGTETNHECVRLIQSVGSSYWNFDPSTKQTILAPDDADAEAWENYWICHNSVPVWNGSKWVLLYSGGNGVYEDTGVAFGDNLTSFTRDTASNPVIVHNNNAPWDSQRAYKPRVRLNSSTWYTPYEEDGKYVVYFIEVDSNSVQRLQYANTTSTFTSFTRNTGEPVLRYDWNGDDGVSGDTIVSFDDEDLFYVASWSDPDNDVGLLHLGDYVQQVYATNCRSDFGDIRFTADDGTTLLDYWLYEKVDSDYAKFWVEIPTISNVTTNTIYIYYGKNDATTTSIDFRENFSSYTEVDPNSHISITNYTVNIDFYRDEDAYLYKDYGANYFQDFEHKIDLNITYVDASAWLAVPLYANAVNGVQGLRNAGENYFHFHVWTGTTTWTAALKEWYGGTEYASNTYAANYDTWYYLTIKKTGTTLEAKIYNDSARTNLLTTLSLTLHSDYQMRYIYVCNTINTATTQNSIGDIANLYIRKIVDPEPSHGAWGAEETPPPQIESLRLSETTNDVNITSINVYTYYDWEVNVTDENTIADLKNVTIRIENNPANEIDVDSPSFDEQNEYWFRYDSSTDSWEWYDGSSWTSTSDWINPSNCSKPLSSATNGWFVFYVRLSKIASYSSQWEFSAIVFDSSDQSDKKKFTGITINQYSEITILTTTHTWTNATAGTNDNLIDEGAITVNVTSNFVFDLEARANSSYLVSTEGYQIGIGNITIHKDTLASSVSLTTTWTDIGGLTNLTSGKDLQYSFKLWLDIPSDAVAWTNYQYKIEVKVNASP